MADELVQTDGVFTRLLKWAGLTRRPNVPPRMPDDESTPVNPPQMPDDLQSLYTLWDQMDQGLVAAVLDTIAEETCQTDYERGRAIWVEAGNDQIVQQGMAALDAVKAEEILTFGTRWMAKNGDWFQRVLYESTRGVIGWQHVCRYQASKAMALPVHRKEDRLGRLVGFKQQGVTYRGDLKREWSWPWDYIHFRLLGAHSSLYGTSVLRAMYQPWWRMESATEGVLRFRLTRTPDRNLITVFVGDLPDDEAEAYTNAVKTALRKRQYVDPTSIRYKVQYNALAPWEDIFIPTRQAEESIGVQTLSGAGNVGEIYDLEHMTNAFFGAAKMPKAYFGFESNTPFDSKATLQQQDARSARMFKRIQTALRTGFRTLLELHYTLIRGEGVAPPDFAGRDAFKVMMHPIAYLEEWERMELLELRYRIMDQMATSAEKLQIDARTWSAYLLLTYAKLPEDFVLRLLAKAPTVPGEAPAAEGFTELTQSEKVAVARMIHESPRIRQIIGDLAVYAADDAVQPVDYSIAVPSGVHDDLTDDAEIRQLNEDLATLVDRVNAENPKPEAKPAPSVGGLWDDEEAPT